MKIKTDFVTNSSSSSFIVIFPKKIESIDDLTKYMGLEKAEVVLRQSLEQIPVKLQKIKDENENVSLIEIINHIIRKHTDEYTSEEILEEIKVVFKNDFPSVLVPIKHIENIILQLTNLYYEELRNCNFEELTNLLLKHEGFIYCFEYSDEGGCFWAEMEHSGTFYGFPHIKISNH